ncbi:fatty acyl-CoA reductase wat-like isoform X1 [Vespa mandarinia]|uniref:fatty acyl-CoA reductase wat-like isoform X1 n=1 Tax=Vespa mandarinia TaxID=7446 RepID=UPI001619E01C|nr:fatty acyl-CoA reductase wat-like isoform X1 [Vespa mandarinia]
MVNTSENRFEGKEMMEVQMKADGQETTVAKKNLDLGKSNEYSPNETLSSIENIDKLTTIQTFYVNQCLFITGGTGFMGKMLIEKLLRGCPGIKCIYVLIRMKKDKSVSKRMEEIFESSLFNTLRKQQPGFQNRIVAIEGDCSLPNLGISTTDRAKLIREVSIVFNVAATVRFNENIKLAAAINVQSLKDLIHLSKEMSKLKSFVHVSTVYANCLQNQIEEKFYDPPMNADKFIALMESMDEKLLDDITPHLLGIWPNTYVYTKSIAENIVKRHAGLMPIGIFRPGIVLPTYIEPTQGWTDNINGLVGITAGAIMGIIRTHLCDGSLNVNIIPGDLTTNALIISGWDIANNRRSIEEIPIYNYTSMDNPITYEEFIKMSRKNIELLPTNEAIWYISFWNIKYRPIYLIYMYFLHILPAIIIDTISLCIGKKPRLLKMYKKIYTLVNIFNYFATTKFNFNNKRWNELLSKLTTEDREFFFCDIRNLIWDTYFKNYILGIRMYILKDPIETLPQARMKWQRLYWIHQALKLFIVCVFLMITWVMIFRHF